MKFFFLYSEQNQALHVVPVLNTKKLQPNQKYSVCYSSNNSSQGAYGCTGMQVAYTINKYGVIKLGHWF